MDLYCPKCDRPLRPWPLERGSKCSPKHWVNCIRNDDTEPIRK